MDKDTIEKEMLELNTKAGGLKAALKEAEAKGDQKKQESLNRELTIASNRIRHLLFKLGKFRYPEDEEIEISPGVWVPANIYHWLKD